MSRLVFLEWDEKELRILDTRAAKNYAQATRTFSMPLEFNEDEDGPAAGLGKLIAKANLGRAECVVSVSRSNCQIREINVPNAPPEELPDMVKLQASSQFSSLGPDWSVDYVITNQSEEHGVEALAAAVSPELIDQIKSTTLRANLTLKKIVLRPFAAASLASQMIGESETALVIDRCSVETDLTVMNGSSILLTRTSRISPDAEHYTQRLASEVKRTVVAARNQSNDGGIDRLILLGDHSDEALAAELGEQVGLPVTILDPFMTAKSAKRIKKGKTTNSGRFASLLGAVDQTFGDPANRIDFLNPRQKPKKEIDKSRIYMYGALALLAVLAIAFAAWLPLRNLNQQIAQKETEIASNADLKKTYESRIAETEVLDKWANRDVVWLDELYRVSDQLPSADDAIIEKMTFRFDKQADKQPRVTMQGLMVGSNVKQIESKLRDDIHKASGIGSPQELKNETPKGYTFTFGEEIRLLNHGPESHIKIANAKKAAAEKQAAEKAETKATAAAEQTAQK